MDRDLIFESFRNCISSKKCDGCEWKACKMIQNRNVGVPVDLALAVTALMAELLKEQQDIVRCKECIRRGTYNCPVHIGGYAGDDEPDDWFCADGERK